MPLKMYKNHTRYSAQIVAYKTLLQKHLLYIRSDFRSTLQINATDVVERIFQLENAIAKVSNSICLRHNFDIVRVLGP